MAQPALLQEYLPKHHQCNHSTVNNKSQLKQNKTSIVQWAFNGTADFCVCSAVQQVDMHCMCMQYTE